MNASAWGLLITGKLVATHSERGMAAALGRALARSGEPVIRQAMDLAMRLLGRQFVTGKPSRRRCSSPALRGARLLLLVRHAGRGSGNGQGRSALRRRLRDAISAIGPPGAEPRHARPAFR